MKNQLLAAFALSAMGCLAAANSAIAVEFRFSAVQVRSGEIIEQQDVIQNYRARQQERLAEQVSDQRAAEDEQAQGETLSAEQPEQVEERDR